MIGGELAWYYWCLENFLISIEFYLFWRWYWFRSFVIYYQNSIMSFSSLRLVSVCQIKMTKLFKHTWVSEYPPVYNSLHKIYFICSMIYTMLSIGYQYPFLIVLYIFIWLKVQMAFVDLSPDWPIMREILILRIYKWHFNSDVLRWFYALYFDVPKERLFART